MDLTKVAQMVQVLQDTIARRLGGDICSVVLDLVHFNYD